MTAFVIAVAVWALIEVGSSLAFSQGGPRTKQPESFVYQAICWAALAGGALWVLLA